MSIIKITDETKKESISTEYYLKAIYKLMNVSSGSVKTQDIANKLGVTSAAVSEMVKKLATKELLDYIPYKGVRLLPEGIKKGKLVIRRHRLIELYLHEYLDIPRNMVHEEAEVLEHFASDYLINKMDKKLGFPQFDPHGAPIPDKNGIIPTHKTAIPLSESKKGDVCKIVRVSNFDSELLEHLENEGITIGVLITVSGILEFDGTVQVRIGEKTSSLSTKICQNIWVDPIN